MWWVMLKKLVVNECKQKKITSKFGKTFIKNFDEDSDIVYIIEQDIEYPKGPHNIPNNCRFYQTEWTFENGASLYAISIKKESFEANIESWINTKKVLQFKVIKFNWKGWLKSYIDVNTKLRGEAKNDFKANK